MLGLTTCPVHRREVRNEGSNSFLSAVISLCICATASGASWLSHVCLGSEPSQETRWSLTTVQSLENLYPSSPPAGLVPARKVSLGLLVAIPLGFGGDGALACPRALSRLLLGLGVASPILVALVVPESITRVPFDEASYAEIDWGPIADLGSAVLSSIGAWFAWAKWKYPDG